MATNSALDAVLDQAAAAADNFSSSNLPATQTTGTALQPSTPRLSLDDMADNSGINVDAYLSVKETGLRIDKNPVFPKAKVAIDITEVVPILSVRANRGGQTTFIKSYDGLTTSQGQSFSQATANLAASHDKVDGPYRTVEVPVTLLQDVPGAKKGQRLGITPAITGVKFWNKFYDEVRKQDLKTATVEVEIVCLPQSNKNNNEWGVVGFNLIGPVKV